MWCNCLDVSSLEQQACTLRICVMGPNGVVQWCPPFMVCYITFSAAYSREKDAMALTGDLSVGEFIQ